MQSQNIRRRFVDKVLVTTVPISENVRSERCNTVIASISTELTVLNEYILNNIPVQQLS